MPEKLVSKVAVFIMLQNEAGEMLLQQRANTGYHDGYYDFACSGHVDEGESIHEAAVRELEEELGIIAHPNDLQLVHINQNFMDTPYLNFTFCLGKWQGEPQILEPHKCSDLRYFSPSALPEKCTPMVRIHEINGFSNTPTYSKLTGKEYREVMKESALEPFASMGL